MARPSEESPYRLLVEGPDDKFSIIHLLERHGFDWDDERRAPFVYHQDGLSGLLKNLSVLLRSSAYSRIGVVLDANASLDSRWRQVADRALREGVRLPDRPTGDGTIVSGPRPGMQVGFWLMPDNQSSGALEHFLGRLVPAEDPTWAYAAEAVQKARELGARWKDHGKSLLHTWLAWQEEPGLPFSAAMKAGVLRQDHADALRFVGWFRRLFGFDET